MHQRQVPARQEAVVDEAVFLDRQPCVAALQIARVIAGDAMAQDQVLRPRRSADRIGLHEAEPVDRAAERGRLEERARDRVAAQIVERWRFRQGESLRRAALSGDDLRRQG